jgi:hypothetical protein
MTKLEEALVAAGASQIYRLETAPGVKTELDESEPG